MFGTQENTPRQGSLGTRKLDGTSLRLFTRSGLGPIICVRVVPRVLHRTGGGGAIEIPHSLPRRRDHRLRIR